MENELLSLGAGGFLVVIILREVFAFLRARKPNADGERLEKAVKLLYELKQTTDDLWTLHNVKDQDGVPVWYIRRSLEESIEKLADAVTSMANNAMLQTASLEQIARENASTLEEIKRMREDRNGNGA